MTSKPLHDTARLTVILFTGLALACQEPDDDSAQDSCADAECDTDDMDSDETETDTGETGSDETETDTSDADSDETDSDSGEQSKTPPESCTAHEQCVGGAACDIFTGECLSADAVWHVDGDGGYDFLSISQALATIGSGEATLIVHELEAGAYVEQVLIEPGARVALLAAPTELPRIQGPDDEVALAIADSTVYIGGLEIVSDRGLELAERAEVHVEGSEIYLRESGEQIELTGGAHLTMRNSMLRGKLRISAMSSFDIAYSTVFAGPGTPVICEGPIAESSLRNNLLVTSGSNQTVYGCAAVSTFMRGNAVSNAVASKPDNTVIGVAKPGWFLDKAAELHLGPMIPAPSARRRSGQG
ncbi:MAG: hypothetical protein HC927_12310 [Deltaproteobacteria bacterium]|nr:hypothetical protein [Deltaproteobacteria bacterium]